MLWEGLNLMLIGMGTVFLFLTLLVFCTQFMSHLIARYFPEAAKPLPSAPPPAPDRRQEEILAAVSATVHHHRQRHRPSTPQ